MHGKFVRIAVSSLSGLITTVVLRDTIGVSAAFFAGLIVVILVSDYMRRRDTGR